MFNSDPTCTIERALVDLPDALGPRALAPAFNEFDDDAAALTVRSAATSLAPSNFALRIAGTDDAPPTSGLQATRDRSVRARSGFRHRGVGLVELLVALAISAALLTAVAVATDTSFKAYAINEEQSNLLQRGRLGLNRLLTYTRTCKEHQPINATQINSFAAGTTVIDTGISMFNDAGQQIDVDYDATNHRVLMSVDGGTARVLARGVIAFQVKMEPMKSPAATRSGGNFDLLRRATILLTLQTSGNLADMNEVEDGQIVTLSSSVMPRRNAW
ncbi:hypothetical protein BH09PLA1_BH09PLA1_25070 [soil metagenome]